MSSKKHLCNYKFLFLHLSLRIYRLRTTQVIFNGNGYDQDSQKMLTEKGLCRIDSGVDAMCRYTEPKNIKLFGDLGVTMSLLHLLPFPHVTSTLIFGLIILKLYWLIYFLHLFVFFPTVLLSSFVVFLFNSVPLSYSSICLSCVRSLHSGIDRRGMHSPAVHHA